MRVGRDAYRGSHQAEGILRCKGFLLAARDPPLPHPVTAMSALALPPPSPPAASPPPPPPPPASFPPPRRGAVLREGPRRPGGGRPLPPRRVRPPRRGPAPRPRQPVPPRRRLQR